jgi:hypothetical protein
MFKIYKAAYRNRNTTRSAVCVSESEKGLPAKSFGACKIIWVIISTFKKTGIFPLSFEYLLHRQQQNAS